MVLCSDGVKYLFFILHIGGSTVPWSHAILGGSFGSQSSWCHHKTSGDVPQDGNQAGKTTQGKNFYR